MCIRDRAGPDRWNSPAWRLELPQPRATALGDLRIAAWPDDPACPVDPTTRSAIESLCGQLAEGGAHVDLEARPDVTLDKAWRVFRRLLGAALAADFPKDKLDELASTTGDSFHDEAKRAAAMRHREWLSEHERRQQIRAKLETFFESYDVLLMPVQPRAAIAHDQAPGSLHLRTVEIGGETRPYGDLFGWIALPGLAYLPSTVVPIGFDADGMPLGVQVVGPYLHDLTTLAAAEMIAEVAGGCPRPPMAE